MGNGHRQSGKGFGSLGLGRGVLERRDVGSLLSAVLAPSLPTSPPSLGPPPAHLATCDDNTCPLVGLVEFMPTVWFLLETRLLFGRVIIPETGRLCFGDQFYIINKDERLEYGPGEKGEVLQPAWGLRTPRSCPFTQKTCPGPTCGGWVVGGGW